MSLSLGEKLLAIFARESDRWLGTHLSERLLARYDARIAGLKQELASIESTRAQLDASSQALLLSTCLVLLAALESSPDGGILFEPSVEREDLLQTSINVMVKPGWATLREHARSNGEFAYELFPRWQAICEHLLHLSEQIESTDIAAHVRQSIDQLQAMLEA